jgi:hypothetical protein
MGFEDVGFAHGTAPSNRAATSTALEVLPNVNTSVVPLDRVLMTDSVAPKSEESAVLCPRNQVTRRVRHCEVGPA